VQNQIIASPKVFNLPRLWSGVQVPGWADLAKFCKRFTTDSTSA